MALPQAPDATPRCSRSPADLPAAVIADLFGMHPETASAWSAYARADWTAYLNSRPAAGSG
jgi:hypothetical protein